MVYTTFYIFIILIYTSNLYESSQRKISRVYAKRQYFPILQIKSKCILTRAERQKQNKAKSNEIRTSGFKVIISLNSESFLDILGEKRSHKNYITGHGTLESANNFLKNLYI